jgi:NAD(P)-dependent dehydrogenase (short-subunit alcohol dehydrogenase family)
MRIIVTGGNSGVGKATAAVLADAGHSVVIACRSIEKAERAAVDIVGRCRGGTARSRRSRQCARIRQLGGNR